MTSYNILKSWIISDRESYKDVIENCIENFQPKQFLGLTGPMGSGKTFFTNKLIHYYGLNKNVFFQSPSFALHHHYQNSQISIDHLDLFRLENHDELESIGFWDLFSQDDSLIIVEWADRINLKLIPKKYNPIIIEFKIENNIRHCYLKKLIF